LIDSLFVGSPSLTCSFFRPQDCFFKYEFKTDSSYRGIIYKYNYHMIPLVALLEEIVLLDGIKCDRYSFKKIHVYTALLLAATRCS
jgi:hypothetical protein